MSSKATVDVIAERLRQQEVEGWSTDHDDRYISGALAIAGACYALECLGLPEAVGEGIGSAYRQVAFNRGMPKLWPSQMDPAFWKPSEPRRNLVKAAALIIAEIERIDRQEHGTDTTEDPNEQQE